jgi:hypothetical protein
MKVFLLFLLFPILSCHTTSNSPNSAASGVVAVYSDESVTGRVYEGPPTSMKSVSGCEGCGERGEFVFHKDGSVSFIYPGSDIKESGTWSQKGNTVTVSNENRGTEVTFIVEDNGKTILDTKYSTRYSLK